MSSVFKKLKRQANELNQHEDLQDQMVGVKRQKTSDKKDQYSNSSDNDSENDNDVKEEEESVSEKSQVTETAEATEEDPEDQLRAFKDADPHSKEWKNRQRVLMVTQRGCSGKFRTLVMDLMTLIPHSKSESKVERKDARETIDGLCFERSCNNFMYFEQRSHQQNDHFLWVAKSPNGPAFKFQVSGITLLEELKLTGNCLQFSRPLLSFDGSFDDPDQPHLQLAKELFSSIFNTPKNHPKSKPFIDHVISFSSLPNGKIFFRTYQILNQAEEQFTEKDDADKLVLIEIGPRFILNPIKAFEGSIGGEALWQNSEYIAPAKIRSKRMDTFLKKREGKEKAKKYKDKILKEGKDPDGYLMDAFNSDSDKGSDKEEGSQQSGEEEEDFVSDDE